MVISVHVLFPLQNVYRYQYMYIFSKTKYKICKVHKYYMHLLHIYRNIQNINAQGVHNICCKGIYRPNLEMLDL